MINKFLSFSQFIRAYLHGLRYKTRTKHYRLDITHGLRYKTRTADYMRHSDYSPWFILTSRNITEYMYKREQTLSYPRALRSVHLFSPLLNLTAQAQNAVPRIFAFLTYQTYQYSNALFNLRLLPVLLDS